MVRRGQVWRLLTSQLSHVSFLHLVLNVAGLWNVSNFAEGAADSGTAFYVGRSLLLLTLSAVVRIQMQPVTNAIHPRMRVCCTFVLCLH